MISYSYFPHYWRIQDRFCSVNPWGALMMSLFQKVLTKVQDVGWSFYKCSCILHVTWYGKRHMYLYMWELSPVRYIVSEWHLFKLSFSSLLVDPTSINEGVEEGYPVITVGATDRDTDANAETIYRILSGNNDVSLWFLVILVVSLIPFCPWYWNLFPYPNVYISCAIYTNT